jgi:hypothetical protein
MRVVASGRPVPKSQAIAYPVQGACAQGEVAAEKGRQRLTAMAHNERLHLSRRFAPRR